MVDILTAEPEKFIAGDTVKWKISLSDYPASAGWVLSYALRGPQSIDFFATASGADHQVTLAAAATAAYVAGKYKFQSAVTKAGERYVINEGYIAVKENLAAITTPTDRLLSLEADITAIESYVAKNYKFASYSIGGRSLNQIATADLLTLLNKLRIERNGLRDEERIRRGLGSGRIIRVRIPS